MQTATDETFKTYEGAEALNLVATNPSGIHPTRHKLLVLPMEVEEKIGNIFVPDSVKEQNKFAQMQGRILEVGPVAFTEFNEDEWQGRKPQAGDLVLYAKYAGVIVKGPADGKDYTILNDEDVIATLEE